MNTWLYQLSEKRWSRNKFLHYVREGRSLEWNHNKIVGEGSPSSGDALIFFYAPTGARVPGICGNAVIDCLDTEEETISFRVVRPTNRLRENPWWDRAAKKLVDKIRGGCPRGTLFYVQKDQSDSMSLGIKAWLQ